MRMYGLVWLIYLANSIAGVGFGLDSTINYVFFLMTRDI